jgi:hypothetical protein
LTLQNPHISYPEGVTSSPLHHGFLPGAASPKINLNPTHIVHHIQSHDPQEFLYIHSEMFFLRDFTMETGI